MSKTTKIIAGIVLLFAAAGAAFAVNGNLFNCDQSTECAISTDKSSEANLSTAGIAVSSEKDADGKVECNPADCDPENCDHSECTAEQKAACAEAKKAGECTYGKATAEKKADCQAWKECTSSKTNSEEKSI